MYVLALLTTSSCFASASDTNRTACTRSPAAVEVATGLAASFTGLRRGDVLFLLVVFLLLQVIGHCVSSVVAISSLLPLLPNSYYAMPNTLKTL